MAFGIFIWADRGLSKSWEIRIGPTKIIMKKRIGLSSRIFWLFLAARIILLVSVPYEIIPGYGDYWNFYIISLY